MWLDWLVRQLGLNRAALQGIKRQLSLRKQLQCGGEHFFELNKKLAQLMEGQQQYNVSVKEIHHTQKKDAPSGTAITIAEQIIANNSSKSMWVNHSSNNPQELSIVSERTDPYPGLHEVTYQSSIDEITIIHNAHSRDGFALGAVLAAEYIAAKKGIFTMKDVLGFGN